MRFPYRQDVGSNLRALFGAERLRATARDLGSSSITRGEGSLDLLQTDAGPVVASFGDLPDGTQGVGVLVGGVMRNAGSMFGEHAASLTSLAGRATSAEGRLSAAEGRLDSHAGRIGATENGIGALGGRMSSAEGKITALQSASGSAAGTLAGIGARVDTAESRLDTHAQRLGALENELARVKLRLGRLEDGAGIPP